MPAEIVEAHAVDDPGAVRALVPEGCDLFVLDSYRLGIQHETALKGWASSTLVLDDRPFRRHAADILLDPTLRRAPGAYEALVAKDTKLLLGPGYALLRPEFSCARLRALARRASTDTVAKILVAFGGGCGARPAIDLVLEGCRISGLSGELHVVAPAACNLPSRSGGVKVVSHGLTADIHRLMVACDLAIGAGGGSAWERCCLGLPTIMVGIADNQSDVAAALAEAGAAIDLGPAPTVTAEMIAQSLCDLASNVAHRREMSSRAARICDGLGARRVAGALAPWFARDGMPVTLRPVGMADAELMHHWQQIPAVRRHTPNPAPPSWETHLGWLESRLADTAAGPFSIIVKDGKDVGVLRLDRFSRGAHRHHLEADALKISIYLEPDSHGQGIGTAALDAARFLVTQAPFYAEVLPGNAASHRLFKRAGYREAAPGLYRQASPAREPQPQRAEPLSQGAHAV